jgi:signal transduction histidine kinase
VQSVAGIACGVPVVVPCVFVGLSVACRVIAGQRTAIVRAMLADFDAEVAARHRVELELRQAQKLEAIGRLAAGVAHEINTPMQYIGDSLAFVHDGVAEVLAGSQDAADAAFLREELPAAVTRASDGVARVAKIVHSLKQFAHPGGGGATPVDLNAAITDTLTIAAHEYKLVADVELRLGDLPLVTCDGGAVNQVLLNLIINAAQAIEEANAGCHRRGTITVTSRRDGDGVRIAVTDTGTGIAELVRPRIFEPFFTTKPVGKGMGHGLAGSRAIVEHHGGRIAFTTEVGAGTTFEVFLPEHGAARSAA